MSARQISQSQIADANAHESFHAKSKALEHPANLAINSLLEHNAQLRRSDLSHARNVRSFAIEDDAAQQLLSKLARGEPIQRHFVFLFNLESRMGQTLRKIAIVRQKEQSFALCVEASDVIERREFRRKQIEDRIGHVRIAPSANKARRFIQSQVNVRPLTNDFAVEFDVIGRRRLKMKIGAGFSIHRYPAARDQFVRAAARSHARGGEKAIETH
jgi:hypothetical protein